MSENILITSLPFATVDKRPMELLRAAGLEPRMNPFGRRLTEAELMELIRDTTIHIAGTEPITARVMDAAPHLRLIVRVGIGLDSVDLDAARQRGIAVAYTPEAPSPAVAELTVGLMLDLLRGISRADRLVRSKKWDRFLGRRLDGLTVGVVGVGRVGKRVIRILKRAFPNVIVLANDLQPNRSFGSEFNVHWVEKAKLYVESDIITLHLPLTRDTKRLITTREISTMKPSSLLINTSRGEIIDEDALVSALTTGQISGAALDVFEQEPYTGPLTDIEECILTCHIGSMSRDCRLAMELEAVEDALRFVRGEPLKRPVPDSEYSTVRR